MNRASQIRQRRALLLWFLWCRLMAGAMEDALLHYWDGLRTYSTGLPVDGWHVAQRMAEALEAVMPGEEEVVHARSA